MKGLIFVAHPDDEFIFAHNLIKRNADVKWDVVCVTYCEGDTRGIAFKESCKIMNVVPILLGLVDDYGKHLDIPRMDLSKYDVIVGEYGHPHHKLCHDFILNFAENTTDIVVFSYNWKDADFRYYDADKKNSPILYVYNSELAVIKEFDLISEGFCYIRNSKSILVK
jgi:LmbE family N-acetylglucosaminyl deacetylase